MITKPQEHKKAWGKELWIVNDGKYCGKILCLDEGYRCSYHYHKIKDETFHILRGRVHMRIEGADFYLEIGDTVHIKPGMKHSFSGLQNSEILEISTQHFEDDSYREDYSGKV
jgi:quercetin dioxygenase-like cupin family protein